MSECCGFDLSAVDWTIVETDVQPDGRLSNAAPVWLTPGSNALEQRLTGTLMDCLVPRDADSLFPRGFNVDQEVKSGMTPLRAEYQKAVHNPKWVSLAVPYDYPPVLRRALPVVTGAQPMPHPPRIARDLSPALIDSPVAACLELLATGRIGLPAVLITLSGLPENCELVVLHAAAGAQGELELRVVGHARLRGSVAKDQLSELVPASVTEKLETPPRVFASEPQLAEVIACVRRHFGLRGDSVLDVGEPRGVVAAGAARYVAMYRDRALRGTTFARVSLHHLVPYSIGIFGVYRDSLPCWRQVLPAWNVAQRTASGSPSGGDGTVELAIGPPVQATNLVQLAEVIRPEYRHVKWLAEQDWAVPAAESPLRIYTSVSVRGVGEHGGKDHMLRLEFHNPTGNAAQVAQVVTARATPRRPSADGIAGP